MQKRIALVIAKVIMDTGLYNIVDFDGFEFRIVVQKIGYILHKVGCNTGLKFNWYTLGPYSRMLQNCYSVVINLLSRTKNVNEPPIKLDDDLRICAEKVIEFLNEFKQYVGSLDIRSLEVLASLIMLCSDVYPEPENPVDELMKRKKNISRDLIEKTWRFLIDRSICT